MSRLVLQSCRPSRPQLARVLEVASSPKRSRLYSAQPEPAPLGEAWSISSAGLAAAAPQDATHSVGNQAQPLGEFNAYRVDPSLQDLAQAAGCSQLLQGHVAAFGEKTGSLEAREMAVAANKSVPVLQTHDARGHRVDTVWRAALTIRALC